MGGVLFFTVIFLWIFLVCFTIKLANRKARLCPWVLEYNFISHFKFWRFWHYIVYFWKKSFKKSPIFLIGLPRWCSGKESACQCRRHKTLGFDPWVGKWQPILVFLLGESHGWKSLVGYSPWRHKESDTTEWLNNNHNRKTCLSVFTVNNQIKNKR